MADLTRHLQEAARLATEVPSSEARAALLPAVTLAALLASRAAELAPEAPASAPVETHGEIATWINGEQALAQYGLSAGFLAEHRGELAQLGAVSKIGHRTFLYRAMKLRAYIQSHLVTTGQDAC